MKSSTKSGQSQLLVPIVMILTSALVFATNTYINSTNMSSPTGAFLAIQPEEMSFSIEVWANTSIGLNVVEGMARAQLLMDNGTTLADQEIKFYINNSLLDSKITDSQGYAEIGLSQESQSVRAVYEGNSSMFLNQSYSTVEISAPLAEELTKEESVTPDGKLVKITNKKNANAIVETEIDGDSLSKIHSNKESFSASEIPEFSFMPGETIRVILLNENRDITEDAAYKVEVVDTGSGKKLRWSVASSSEQSFLIKKESKKITKINAYVEGPCCKIVIPAEITKKGKDYGIKVNGDRSFKPGLYKLVVEFDGGKEEYWFSWGLISINTDKSIYHLGETSEITMIVLDKEGHLSGSEVSLNVTGPDGVVQGFSTSSGSISSIYRGIYKAYYQTTAEGNYSLFASAKTDDINSSIESYFLAKSYYEFDIIRSTPHVTDPTQGPFESKIKIISYTDASTFSFKEYLPLSFEIASSGGASIERTKDSIVLTWPDIENNSVVSYEATPPFIWPYLYQIGPAEVIYNKQTFTEARPWMLAVDPATICSWQQDDSNWAWSNTAGGGGWGTAYNWTLGTNCTQAGGPASGCYIRNITVSFYAASSGAGTQPTEFRLRNVTYTGGYYYPASFTLGAPYTLGPMLSCGAQNNYTTSNSTCNLNTTHNFTALRYSVEAFVPGKGSVSIPLIKYEWCWPDYFPHLESPLVNGTQSEFSAGWGSVFNFSVMLWEPTRNLTNVSLWYSKTAGTNFMYSTSRNVSLANDTAPGNMTNFTMNFSCSSGDVIDSRSNNLGVLDAAKYYKFNATNNLTNRNDTYNYYGNIYFTPIKDNLTLSNATVNGSIINRTSSINLSQAVNDSIRNVRLGSDEVGGSIYIQKDGTNFNSYTISGTNSSGYINYNLTSNTMCTDGFNPGVQKWYTTSSGSSCYYGNNSQNMSLTIYGILTASVPQPSGSPQYDRGQTVSIKGRIVDDCGTGRTGLIVNFTLKTGANTYYCNPVTETPGEAGNYSCSWDSNLGVAGTYNITVNTSAAYHYNSTTAVENAFTLVTTPRLNAPSVTPSSGGWGQKYNYTITIDDATGEVNNVTFWLKAPGGSWAYQGSKNCTAGTNCTNVWFNRNYTCNSTVDEKGTWFYRFNATDILGTANGTAGTENHLIGKDNVTVSYAFGNNSVASIDTPAALSFRVYDWENTSYPQDAYVSFNITKHGSGTEYYTMNTVQTNSTGYANYNFYADPSFDTINQNWTGYTTSSDNCYSVNRSYTYNNLTTRSNVPRIENESVDTINGGWGIARRLNVSVYDYSDIATVYLWLATSTAGPWTLIDQKSYTTPGSSQNFSFLENFTCSNQSTWYYKFNVSNAIGNMNSTSATAQNNFTIGKDTVIFTYYNGHNTTSNRSGSQKDLLVFYAQDLNGTVLTSFPIKYSVTTNNISYYTDSYFVNATNSTGYANLYFNPTCLNDYTGAPKFAVGSQQWKAEVNDSELGCYNQNDTSSLLPRNLTVMGNILINLNNPDGTINVTQESTMQFLGYS
ncbi:MAG: hypothetical protein V1850_02325, partial [Candidatus Bathyarchaeota archaeon]